MIQRPSEIVARESRIEGLGVFAGRPFDAGDVVLVLDTSRVVDEARPLRPELGDLNVERHAEAVARIESGPR